jgi:hypothetical protein
MGRQAGEGFAGPWVLPIVYYETRRYFIDLRLRQFREVENPHDFHDFDGEGGRQMCRQTGVTVCPACGMAVIVATILSHEELRCMSCFRRIVGDE